MPEKIENLVNAYENAGYSQIKSNNFIEGLMQIASEYKEYLLYMCILLFINFILAIIFKKENIIKFLFGNLVMLICIVGYIAYNGRIVSRVMMALFFSQIVMYIIILFLNDKFILKVEKMCENNVFSSVLIICLAVWSCYKIISLPNLCGQETLSKGELNKYRYFAEHKENFYIQDVNGANNGERYVHFIEDNSEKNYMSLGDCIAYSPAYYKKLENLGVKNMRELCFKDNVYLVVWSLKKLENYNLFGEDVIVEKVDEIDVNYTQYSVYKVRNKF